MSGCLKVCLSACVFSTLSLLLFSPSLANAEDRTCDIVPEGTNWNCSYSNFKRENSLVFRELKLDEVLKSAETQEQAFLAFEAAYTEFGNLNDFTDWLRAQGFDVSPSWTSGSDQVGGVKIIFDAAYWELFDSFWSSLSRSIGNPHTRIDVRLSLHTSGRFKEIATVWAK